MTVRQCGGETVEYSETVSQCGGETVKFSGNKCTQVNTNEFSENK